MSSSGLLDMQDLWFLWDELNVRGRGLMKEEHEWEPEEETKEY